MRDQDGRRRGQAGCGLDRKVKKAKDLEGKKKENLFQISKEILKVLFLEIWIGFEIIVFEGLFSKSRRGPNMV